MEHIEDYEIKCGETFLTLNGNIIFHCTLCENRYKGFQEYAEHVETDHYAPTLKEETSSTNFSKLISPTSPSIEENDFDSEDEIPVNIKIPNKGISHVLDETELDFTEIKNRKKKIFVETQKYGSELYVKVENNTNQSTYQSNICDQTFPPSTKAVPLECFSKNKHKCTECNYSTDFRSKLRHFGERTFKCTECCSQFYRSNDLNKHASKHKNQLKYNEYERKGNRLQYLKDVPSMTTSNDGKFKCTVCDYVSKDKSNMWSHIKRHSAYKPHECQDCSKSFYTRNELNTHIRSHTGEKPYLCTECGHAFSTSSKLSQHIKKHGNLRDKQCPECSMKFFNTHLLKNHMAVHSEVRPHICSVCNASFKQRTALNNHMKLHDNKQEYECQLCPARFNQRPGLISHVKSKHSIISDTNIGGKYCMP